MSFSQSNKIIFTPREKEILIEIAHGKTTTEISEICAMKPETVKTHIRNMFEKTGKKTRAALVSVFMYK